MADFILVHVFANKASLLLLLLLLLLLFLRTISQFFLFPHIFLLSYI
jgi:hypothetical protein